MKKIFGTALLAVLICAFMLSGCSEKECEHNIVVDEAIAPTCTEDGKTEGYHCSVCGEITVEQTVIEAKGHEVVWDPAVQATCTENGLTRGKHCSVCNEVLKEQTVVNKLGHLTVKDPAEDSTCYKEGKTEGSHCSRCNTVFIAQETIDKLEHTVISNDAIAPTCTRYGSSEYDSCEVCHEILGAHTYIEPLGHNYVDGACTNCLNESIDYTDISIYRSYEGYEFFKTAANGEAMRQMYDEMEAVLSNFHNSTWWDAGYEIENEELGTLQYVYAFDYAKFGLNIEEAKTVYTVFRKDHPVFYWMTYWLYWNSSTITITTVDEFALAEDRQEYNRRLYETIEEYYMLAAGETSAYNITMIYYEAIIKNNEYAYTEDMKVEPEMWAHGIIGDVLYDKFVCEGYAKLLQLLLNISGVENMYISGGTPGSHFWNLVYMDDGKWYWVDPTWGDAGNENINPVYFCAIDSDMPNHIPTPSNTLGMYFNITLPDRAESHYGGESSLELNERLSLGGREYVRSGFDSVTPLGDYVSTDDKLIYNGAVYKIIQ